MRKKMRGSPLGAGRKEVALMQLGVTRVQRSLGFFVERARRRRSAPGGSGVRGFEPSTQRITVACEAGEPEGAPAQPRIAREMSACRRGREKRWRRGGGGIGAYRTRARARQA